MKNKTCPVEIYVGVLELTAGKYSILESGDDECTVLPERFQKTIQRFSCERREIIVFSGFRLYEPGMSTFDAEVVAEFVGGEGFDRVEISIPFFFSGEKREESSRVVNIFSLRRRGPI